MLSTPLRLRCIPWWGMLAGTSENSEHHMSHTEHQAHAPGHEHGYAHQKDDHLRRLKRIEGQARGLQRLITEDAYCIDILTQVSAMTKALESFALVLLDEHLNHCVAEAVAEGGDIAQEKLTEASAAIARLVRS